MGDDSLILDEYTRNRFVSRWHAFWPEWSEMPSMNEHNVLPSALQKRRRMRRNTRTRTEDVVNDENADPLDPHNPHLATPIILSSRLDAADFVFNYNDPVVNELFRGVTVDFLDWTLP